MLKLRILIKILKVCIFKSVEGWWKLTLLTKYSFTAFVGFFIIYLLKHYNYAKYSTGTLKMF